MAAKITWTPETAPTPELLIPLLNDIGLGEESIILAVRAREATRKYCLSLIMEDTETGMGELSILAGAFYEGYLASTHDAETAKTPGYLDAEFDQARKVLSVLK